MQCRNINITNIARLSSLSQIALALLALTNYSPLVMLMYFHIVQTLTA